VEALDRFPQIQRRIVVPYHDLIQSKPCHGGCKPPIIVNAMPPSPYPAPCNLRRTRAPIGFHTPLKQFLKERRILIRQLRRCEIIIHKIRGAIVDTSGIGSCYHGHLPATAKRTVGDFHKISALWDFRFSDKPRNQRVAFARPYQNQIVVLLFAALIRSLRYEDIGNLLRDPSVNQFNRASFHSGIVSAYDLPSIRSVIISFHNTLPHLGLHSLP